MSLTIIPIIAFSVMVLCTFGAAIASIATWREDLERAREREQALRQIAERHRTRKASR
jgi:prefoldin subunit 5